MMKISSGNKDFDMFLEDGYEKDIINTIYGPAGSGKTLLCMLACIGIARSKKVIFIDTEGGFSVERFKQVCPDYEDILENIIFLKPVNFQDQKNSFNRLKDLVNDRIGLIIVDTISMLYRLEMGKSKDIYEINRELGQQLSYLSQISRTKNIPIIITNQVYADFQNKNNVKIVGGDLLKYASKCMIELKLAHNQVRKAILRKHRSIISGKSFCFNITQEGIKKKEKDFIPQ